VNVERTIEFILESQAKTETRLTGITKLVQQGMRILAKTNAAIKQLTETQKQLAEAQKRTDRGVSGLAHEMSELAREMKELSKAHKETERTLQSFIKAQRNGRNGH
jgi:seryl-tRNA synthetase